MKMVSWMSSLSAALSLALILVFVLGSVLPAPPVLGYDGLGNTSSLMAVPGSLADVSLLNLHEQIHDGWWAAARNELNQSKSGFAWHNHSRLEIAVGKAVVPVLMTVQIVPHSAERVESARLMGLFPEPSWIGEGNQIGGHFGRSVAAAGDVNGDGYGDVIVGMPTYDGVQGNEGAVFVYYGSETGLGTIPDWAMSGGQPDARFGSSVASAGDVNGDGYADIIVGAVWYDNGQMEEGRAYVYHGSEAGLSITPDWIAESDSAKAYFGRSVGTAGDVNGDGYADVIVGASSYDESHTDGGRAYVYHGSAGGLSVTPSWTVEGDQAEARLGRSVGLAGDVNGDGYADVIIGAWGYDGDQADEGKAYVYHGSETGLGIMPDWIVEGDQVGAYVGIAVGTAGDVNGDGYADVIVGASGYDNVWTDAGRAEVYHGSETGLSAVADWMAEGDQAGAEFGISVGTAGDVDGDGYTEIIVGAYLYDDGEVDEGRSYVYHGSAVGLGIDPDWMDEGDQADAWFGESVGAAGDVNGDGQIDAIVGARRYDHGEEDEGVAFVYFAITLISGLEAVNDSPTPLGSVTTLTATVAAGSNVSYTWAFGDGQFSGGEVVTHTYEDVGVYTAIVTASNSVSELTTTTAVTVDEVIAGLEATNDSPTRLGNVTTLTATITAGSNVTYTWAFGDGESGSGAGVMHTYPAAGPYTAVVTASNSVSQLTATTPVTIAGPTFYIYLPTAFRSFWW